MEGLDPIRLELEELQLERDHDDIWNQYCDNCRKSLRRKREIWVHFVFAHEDDDEPTETHYCACCISVIHSHHKAPAWKCGD